MVEITVAIFVVAVGLLGAFAMFSTILRTTGFVSQRFTAFYLAQEGAEILINVRDSNLIKISRGQMLPNGWKEGLIDCIAASCRVAYTGGPAGPFITNTTPTEKLIKRTPAPSFYTYDDIASGNATSYSRTIELEPVDANTLKATITVSWDQGGATRSFELQNYIHQWSEE